MTQERRDKKATRERVQQLIDQGWEIVKRLPLTLKRGNGIAEVKPSGNIVYGRGDA